MSYLVLARKYRPQTFSEVVGQDHVTRTLTNAITAKRVHHAVLFSGPRGTGKTTIARILAKAMNCEQGPTPTPCNKCVSCLEITSGSGADVFEIDGASNNSVDQIRELRENIKYMPAHSRYKIYIIDEVHMLSIAAFNALLKTLEEPPGHVLFFFATTEPHKIPLTILSRCQRHDFKRLDLDTIVNHLKQLCEKEAFSTDEESLAIIAHEADGCMRDALSLLDQLMACVEGQLTPDRLMDLLGIVDQKLMFDISHAVFNRQIPKVIEILDYLYARGHDIKKIYQDIIRHFRNLLVVKMGSTNDTLFDLSKKDIALLKDQVQDVSLVYINQVLNFLFDLDGAIRYSEQPKLILDVAFIKLLNIQPVLPIDTLIEKIDRIKTATSNIENGQLADERVQYGASVDDGGALNEEIPEARPKGEEADQNPVKKKAVKQDEKAPKVSGSQDLERVWEQLYRRISETHPSIAASLRNSTLSALNDDTVEIEINGNEFNLKLVKREKNLSAIQSVCEDYFAKPVKVVIIEKKKKENNIRQKKDEEKKLKESALNHPMISEAIEIFKGRIIDIKILEGDKK